MRIIINSKHNSTIETNKLKIKIDKFFKTEIKTKIDRVIIFFTVDLITNLVLKPNKIIYYSIAKMFLVTCLYFKNNE